jgi:N6-adenosine-specific RNA methylase IME4
VTSAQQAPAFKVRNIGLAGIAVTTVPERMRGLRSEVVTQIADSMRAIGQLQPIVVRPASIGYFLVAGLHRLEAARSLKWRSISALIVDTEDADRALLAEIDENLIRADLSAAERALHLKERKRVYEALYPQTKAGGDRKSAKAKSNRQNGELISRFTKDTAEKTKRSERTVQRDIARADKIAGLKEAVGTSLDKPEELDKLAKLPEPVQSDLIRRAAAGEKVTARHVAHKLAREQREQKLAAATEAASRELGTKLYGVLYADPAWKFEVRNEDTGLDHAAEAHYPTMETADIAAIPVPAADDAVLFLWATVPMLPQALVVMEAWGFTYKSLIVWDKGIDGTGYWARGRVEILLIGIRGKGVPAPARGDQPPQLIAAPRGRHSEKPDVFAEHIERLFPNVPKLEMFARKARKNWSTWGNEVPAAERGNEGDWKWNVWSGSATAASCAWLGAYQIEWTDHLRWHVMHGDEVIGCEMFSDQAKALAEAHRRCSTRTVSVI